MPYAPKGIPLMTITTWLRSRDRAAGCWLWPFSTTSQIGYGQVWFEGKPRGAHRVAFVLNGGVIPEGMIVRHSCDTPLCINPEHLLIGSYADNSADMVARGRSRSRRMTECSRGHPFNLENTYVDPSDGHRRCRACIRLRR